MFKNCKLAKIEQDIGARGGERLGVAQQQVSLDTKNCKIARICNDLGEQWNEQGVAVGTVNSMCKIAVLQNCTPTSASSGTSRACL